MIIDQGKGKSNAKVNADENSRLPVYDRNTLSKLSDEELKRMHNEMTERYIEDLPPNADGEKYRNELNKSLTGRDSVISSIVRQNGEIGHPAPQNQINPDIKIDSARQLKIQDILSVDKAQLSKMSIPELKEFAAEAAKVNAESMGASSEKMKNYIAQSTAGNEAALIKNIEGIQGDLEIELNNMVLKDSGDNGKSITLQNLTSEIIAAKPKNSPAIEKWLSSNGKISIDKNGNWIYTNTNNQSVKYVNGYPDFKDAGFVIEEIDIGEFINYSVDFAKADKLLSNGGLDYNIYTWHHLEDEHTLQSMDKKIHKQFTHRGGMSKTKSQKKGK